MSTLYIGTFALEEVNCIQVNMERSSNNIPLKMQFNSTVDVYIKQSVSSFSFI